MTTCEIKMTPQEFIKILEKKEGEEKLVHELVGFTAVLFGEKHCGKRMVKVKRFMKGGDEHETEAVLGCLVCGYAHEEHEPGY